MKVLKTIRTAKNNGERLNVIENPEITDTKKYNPVLDVDSSRTYQQILGFGGAFTEAAAVTLSKMSVELRNEALRMYYDPEEGLGYTMGRVHINSCDFSLGNYCYVDENDSSLTSFSIEHDQKQIIPLIRDAAAVAGEDLLLLASPWSPPAWMKTSNKMNNGGKLLDGFKECWADYFVNFINAYRDAGLDIWGVTVQNEPAAVQLWESCVYTAQEERDFVKYYLGPRFRTSGLEGVKIIIWDHNRDLMVERARDVLEDPEAAAYIWGTGYHWYGCEDFGTLGELHELFPDKHLLFTEGCVEGGSRVGEWEPGEQYGRNMIGDFNNWCEGYLDWNLVLDENGGPNHAGNLCDAPIIADTVNGRLHYNSSYYYIGHFSKYVKPGAIRIFSRSDPDEIHSAAFLNPDGTVSLVVMNEGDSVREVSIRINDGYLNESIINRSITTYCLSV